jgi:hypothetical protein
MPAIAIAVGKHYVAWVDEEDVGLVLDGPKWQPDIQIHTVYASRKRSFQGVRVKEYMHRLIVDARRDHVVDHEDGNGLMNRRYNLRRCTQANNVRCRRTGHSGTSRYRGVYWSKREKKWFAKVTKDGRAYICGQYVNEIAAARAYNVKARRLFGQYAQLNVIPQACD